MKTTRSRTGFGLYDTARQIARRQQGEIDRTENPPPPPPPMRMSPETELALELFLYARSFKRPLAA